MPQRALTPHASTVVHSTRAAQARAAVHLQKRPDTLARKFTRAQGSNALAVAEELRLMLVCAPQSHPMPLPCLNRAAQVHRDASLAALKAEAEDQAAVIQVTACCQRVPFLLIFLPNSACVLRTAASSTCKTILLKTQPRYPPN